MSNAWYEKASKLYEEFNASETSTTPRAVVQNEMDFMTMDEFEPVPIHVIAEREQARRLSLSPSVAGSVPSSAFSSPSRNRRVVAPSGGETSPKKTATYPAAGGTSDAATPAASVAASATASPNVVKVPGNGCDSAAGDDERLVSRRSTADKQYYGDPADEGYRSFMTYALTSTVHDNLWLTSFSFLGPDVQRDCERLKNAEKEKADEMVADIQMRNRRRSMESTGRNQSFDSARAGY